MRAVAAARQREDVAGCTSGGTRGKRVLRPEEVVADPARARDEAEEKKDPATGERFPPGAPHCGQEMKEEVQRAPQPAKSEL